MGRTKVKEWEQVNYSLEKGVKDVIKEISEFEGMSASNMIGFLVKNWDAGINPSNKLSLLLNERKGLKDQMDSIDDKIQTITAQIKMFDTWKKQKQQDKIKAIPIIKRQILNNDFEMAESFARFWQGKIGVPAIELISEASEQLRKSGI